MLERTLVVLRKMTDLKKNRGLWLGIGAVVALAATGSVLPAPRGNAEASAMVAIPSWAPAIQTFTVTGADCNATIRWNVNGASTVTLERRQYRAGRLARLGPVVTTLSTATHGRRNDQLNPQYTEFVPFVVYVLTASADGPFPYTVTRSIQHPC